MSNTRKCTCKKTWANNIICRLLQGLWLHRKREDGANTTRIRPTLRNRRSQNKCFIKNTKVKVRSPDGDTDYFDILAGVLQKDTLAPYLFIICQDYVLWTSVDKMKERFQAGKGKKQKIPAHTITDADYADDIALLANTLAQAETVLHSLERAAGGIGLHINADKTEIHVL